MIGREVRLALGAMAATFTLLAGAAPVHAGTNFDLVDIGNFEQPVFADDAPEAAGHLYVVEKAGTISVLVNEVEEPQKFLDIRDLVTDSGEQGLLSIAFDPGYATNRRFYVYSTANSGDIRIDRFKRRADDPLRADESSRKLVIKIEHDQATNHNGGQVHFGPDGYLYAATGDGGPQMDPENDAQRKNSLLGKLIRIDPLAGGGYANPPDNPFVGKRGRNEIAARGLRNPWRFSFDSATGALTIGDVGGQDREEINYVSGQGLGKNFGWNDFEGFQETSFGIGSNAKPHRKPVAQFDHSGDGFCAITGGYVVRDSGLPALAGQYVFSDLCANQIRAMTVPGGAASGLGVSTSQPVSFGEGAGGQIYVASLGGNVFRLEQVP